MSNIGWNAARFCSAVWSAHVFWRIIFCFRHLACAFAILGRVSHLNQKKKTKFCSFSGACICPSSSGGRGPTPFVLPLIEVDSWGAVFFARFGILRYRRTSCQCTTLQNLRFLETVIFARRDVLFYCFCLLRMFFCDASHWFASFSFFQDVRQTYFCILVWGVQLSVLLRHCLRCAIK